MASILIIDDEDDIRGFARVTLEKAGHQIQDSDDAAAQLLRLESGEVALPDVILLDAIMPRMDGWAFLRRIKENAALRQIPVVLCSSLVDFEHSKLPPGATVAATLDKPFAAPLLVETIAKALAAK